jgi:aspartate/methionine/tyrosine aminotransferase
VRWMKPEGAFYGFLHVDGLNDSMALARDLVLKANVGTAPGSAFGLAIRATRLMCASVSPATPRA